MRAALAFAAAVLAVAVVLPLALLVGSLLADPSALGSIEATPLRNTAILALGTTGLAVAAGVPLGVVFGRTDLPGARVLRLLATLPYVVPPYVSAIAWIALLNPTTGWLAVPGLDIYGLPGMIWVLGLESAPIVMLATADALGRMDPSLEEQARVAGAGPLRVLARVTLPLAGPAIATSAAFVLASAAAAFGVPYLLASGSPAPAFVLTTRIAQALDLDPTSGRPRAVALSTALLLLSVAAPALVTAFFARRSVATVGGKASRSATLNLGRWAMPVLAGVVGFVAVGGLLPLGTLVALSVTAKLGHGFGPDNWSLGNYAAVLGQPRDLVALGRSLAYAGGAATAATAFGALVAVLDVRTTLRGRGALTWLARSPYPVPGTVLALGLLLAWSQEIRVIVLDRVTLALCLANTGWLLILAYAVKYLALPVGGIAAALRSVDPALEEAARVAGASQARSLVRITAPIVAPSLASSWFLVFVPAFGEVTMSILLSGPGTRVVGVVLFELQTYGDPPQAAALAVIVAAVSIAGQALAGIRR